MGIIRNLDTLNLFQIRQGQVDTQGAGAYLYLVKNADYIININADVAINKSDAIYTGLKVRLVKGAFHVEG